MFVSATIVTYKNDFIELEKTINSFLNTSLPVRLYVVDNSPTDEIKQLCLDDRIEYCFMNANIGFGAGHNVILKDKTKLGEYHIILNPDIYWEKGVIEELYEYMNKNADIGNIMPKILYPNGEVQYLCKLLPKPINWIGRILIPFKSIKDRLDYMFEMRFTDYNEIMDVPYLSGCFMFLRKETIIKVGFFDEGIFMYGEDTDLNRRIRQFYRTVYYPKVSIVHNFAKGSHKEWRLFKIHVKAAIYYFNKWGWFFDKERRIINRKTILQHKEK